MPSDIDHLLPTLSHHAKADLDITVTALESLHRLGAELGIELLAKRDDTIALAMGGNKVRQLEYYLGLAQHQHADTVLITGAVQSNFVRLCAAATRKLGWHPVVQLEHRVPNDSDSYQHSGNVLLNHLLGAELHYFSQGDNEAAADASLDAIAEECRHQGRNPYVVHLGTEHPPIGALGYAECAAEVFIQCQQRQRMPDHVVIPSGSGLTHAGFLVGARRFGWQVPIHGICVRRDAAAQYQRILQRAVELNELLNGTGEISAADVLVYDSVLAPGYGQMNEPTMAAITASAQAEGLLLDPVYSGRTMAGLIALVEAGLIEPGQTVLFIHTGGLPSLFAYQSELMDSVQP